MSDTKILASVNGSPITENEVNDAILAMGQRGESLMNAQGRKMILEQLINRKLLLAGAQRDLLEYDPAFKAELAAVKDELLAKFALRRAIESIKVSDEELNKFYEENRARLRAGETVTASHILVTEEEKAKEIREKLIAGTVTFAEAAREYSTCPSSQNGGELGSFGRGQMVKEFDDAVFDLPVNTVSEPVKTQFGWHLILVTNKEEDRELPLDAIRDQLYEQLLSEKQQKAYASKINQLKILFPVDLY